MSSLFSKYFRLREEQEDSPVVGVTSHIKLQKKQGNNDFSPFVIDKSSHAKLAIINREHRKNVSKYTQD